MEQVCTICLHSFDSKMYVPMIVCFQQHYYCFNCVNNIFLVQRHRPTCPECRQELRKSTIVRFRLYEKCSQKIKQKVNDLSKEFKDKISERQRQFTEQTCLLLKEIVLTGFGQDTKRIRSSIKSKVSVLMNLGMFEASITLLQRVIESYPQSDQQDFLGLGSREQQKDFYQNCNYSQYQLRYSTSNISLEDILAIAFLRMGNYKKQVDCYQHMYWHGSKNMRILYGLALAEQNFDNDAKALNIYKEIIDNWPKFDKPYQMMAFIYLKQNDYKLASKQASLCLDRSQGNIFALYIQAVTKMDNCQQVSKYILHQILRKQPKYTRAKNTLSECNKKIEEKVKKSKAIQQKLQQHNKQNVNPLQIDGQKSYQIVKEVSKQLYPSFFLDICLNGFINKKENLAYYEGVRRFNGKQHEESIIAFSKFKQPEGTFFNNYHLIFIAISYLKLEDYESSFNAAAEYLSRPQYGRLLNLAHKILIFCCKKLGKLVEARMWREHWTFQLQEIHEVDDKMEQYLLKIQINEIT